MNILRAQHWFCGLCFGPGVEEGEPLISSVDGVTSSGSIIASVPRTFGFGYSLSGVKCFGVDLTPDNVAVAMVYFVQGVLGLAKLAVSFYLKDDLHLDPAEVCSFYIRVSFLLNLELVMNIIFEFVVSIRLKFM